MKNILKLSVLFALGFVVYSCGTKEEDEPVKDTTPACTQSDWIGSYSGIMNCGGDTTSPLFTITASGSDAVILKYEDDNSSTEYDPITPTGCTLGRTTSESGLTLTVSASIDGNKLMFTEIFTMDGESDTCVMAAVRK